MFIYKTYKKVRQSYGIQIYSRKVGEKLDSVIFRKEWNFLRKEEHVIFRKLCTVETYGKSYDM